MSIIFPKIIEMRALSIAQPWVHCILHEGKNIENRNWNTHFRGTIAIHASGSKSKERFEKVKSYGIELSPHDLPYMAIVGFAEIIDVVTESTARASQKKWFLGPYGFVLTNIIALKAPVKAQGSLNFWKLSGQPLDNCLSQLTHAQINTFKAFKKGI